MHTRDKLNTHEIEDMSREKPVIFECLRLFQVEESSPAAGGERPIQSFGNHPIARGIIICSIM